MKSHSLYLLASLLILIRVPAAAAEKSTTTPATTSVSQAARCAKVGINGAVAADSNERFRLWLNLCRNVVEGVAKGQGPILLADSILGHTLATIGLTEWQGNVMWSFNDMGYCEEPVKADVQRLDSLYKKDIYSTCIYPGSGAVGGRACIMRIFACDAARHKFDHMAWEMAIATQQHNPPAALTIRAAGDSALGSFLRSSACQ